LHFSHPTDVKMTQTSPQHSSNSCSGRRTSLSFVCPISSIIATPTGFRTFELLPCLSTSDLHGRGRHLVRVLIIEMVVHYVNIATGKGLSVFHLRQPLAGLWSNGFPKILSDLHCCSWVEVVEPVSNIMTRTIYVPKMQLRVHCQSEII
jgi:hypothetical protein